MQDPRTDDMLFDLDEDSATVEDPGQHGSPPCTTMLGMPLHPGAPSSAANLPVSSISPFSMSPTSPHRIRTRPSFPGGAAALSRRSTSTSSRSQGSSSNPDASTIGPRGSVDSVVSREASLDFQALQGQLGAQPSADEGASSPEGPAALPPQSLSSGLQPHPPPTLLHPGGRHLPPRPRMASWSCCFSSPHSISRAHEHLQYFVVEHRGMALQ